MNCRFNKPIRTYGKNKIREVIIPIPKLVVSTLYNVDNEKCVSLSKESDEIAKKKVDDDSKYNDTFETTFDRLLKNARIPPKASKQYDTASMSSTDNSFNWSVNKSKLDSIKLIPKQKIACKQKKMHVIKKTIVKNKTSVVQNSGKFKVQKKDTSHKKYKLRNRKNYSKVTSDSLNLSLEDLISKSKSFKQGKRTTTKKHFAIKRKKDTNAKFFSNKEEKSCFVVLDTSVSKLNNELNVVDSKLLKETHKHVMETDQSSSQHNIAEICNNNLKHDDVSVECIQQCSVKVEKLKVDSFLKLNNFEKGRKDLISSTPNNRPIGLSTHLIQLSPIPIKYSEELKDLVTFADNVSTSKNDQIFLESKQINNDLYKKPDVSKECESEEKPESLSNFLTNTSTFSKYNFKQSENLDKKDIISLNTLNCNSSYNCDQDCIVVKDSVQDILTNETKENNTPDKSISIQKCVVSNIEKKKPSLRFSLDTNRSCSLFDNTDENDNKYCIQPSYVILKKLKDTIKVTKRRKYSKWDFDLLTISENCSNSTEVKEKQIFSETANENKQTIMPEKEMSLENIMEESIINTSIQKPVYLKPGKSWARSLSILNNVQNEYNLDKLSIGKGKKWRHSVQDILNMQKQGIVQSCISKYNNDKERQITNETINKLEHELVNKKNRTCDSTKLGRLSRRISVRVVPIHKTVKSIEDVPFLEAYGIVPVKSQRFTLLNNPRTASICNIQNDNVDGQIIEERVVSSTKEVILQKCLQKDYIPFSTCFSDSYLDHCRKIGEGVYGEVFLYEEGNKKSVIKIIPIEGSEYVNGEPQKKFHEILSEIVIAMELHNLRFNTKYNTDGFVEVKSIKCIKGKYPEKLIELWNAYDEEKRSDNDCPLMFNDDQLYIVLELGHGGQDLEAFVFATAEEAHILFIQTALALAVAEKAVEFEHRDLHWGNILISPTNESHVHYKLGQKNIELISKNVKVSIIDFTLSRVTYQGCSVFNDLASDPTLFTAQGEYQFEIYRLMKDKVTNNWQKFEPYTNILWLHYTLDKMITAVRYKKKNLRSHKNGIMKLKELKNEILMYTSAFDFVTNCDKIVNLLHIDTKLE
ncbi:Serine/threonine-protein kinase haspin homolog [Anthophora retusa]